MKEAHAHSHEDHNDDEQKSEIITYEEGRWCKYLWGANAAKLLSKRFYQVNVVFGLYYLVQFTMAVSAANFYSD